jgi:hypothetical protein
MRKSKWIKILASVGIVFLIIFVVIPPFTRKWYRNHSIKYAPPASTSSWKKFSSPAGKFSVWFPGTPEFTNIIANTPLGDIQQSYFFVWVDKQDEYAVSYCDYPEKLKLTPNQQFDLSQAAVAKKFGEIVFQQDIKLGDNLGREFEFAVRGKGNFSGRVRIILAEKRLYQMMVIFLTVNPHPADRATFLNSFKILAN